MTNVDLAKAWLKEATIIFDEAQSLLQKKVWHLVVRRSQEVTELALKAILAHRGIDIPKRHDVGHLFKQHGHDFPPAFQSVIEKIAIISRQLQAERETSFYGDDELGLPADEIYTESDAKEAIEKAEFILNHSQTHLAAQP